MSRCSLIIGVALAMLTAAGCSAASVSPATPGTGQPGEMTAPIDARVASKVVPWGFYDISIDTASWSVGVTPLRTADFTVDVVTFLQPPAGKLTNLKLTVTDVSEWFDLGKIGVDVTLTHPFPGMDQYTGHDVTGVLMSPGSIIGKYDDGVLYTNGVDGAKLLNADGYTRWMNPAEFAPDGTIFNFVSGKLGSPDFGMFTSTINGFKYFADGLVKDESVAGYYGDPLNVHNRGQFRAGAANTREYELQFPFDVGPILQFQYGVIAHWVEPTEIIPGDIPGSFPPEANADEAIYLAVTADNSTLWYEVDHGGGDVSLDIEIFDQGLPHDPDGVPGEISGIAIEAYDENSNNPLPSDYVFFPLNELDVSPGSTGISSVVTIEIPNCTPASLLPITFLLTVESADPTTFDPGTGNPPVDANLAAYSFYTETDILPHEPTPPQGTQVTDLKLKTNRVSGGTAIESLELYWTDTGDPQYAVYRDADPYDNSGVINIDYTTPVLLVDGSPAIITDFDGNGGYVFTVRSRSTADDPATESVDSNLALIEMDNGGSETDEGNWLMGGNSIYLGQMRMQRGAGWGNAGGWGYFVDNGCWADACMVMWSTLCTPAEPEIPDATESFIEWGHWYYDCWKKSNFYCGAGENYPGFTGGGATAPPPEPIGYADPTRTWFEYDIFYNYPDDPPGGFGDPATHVGYPNLSITELFGTPTTSAMWHGTNQTWLLSRVNAGITDADFDYAAVTCSTWSTLNNWQANEGHYYMDDLAVIVY